MQFDPIGWFIISFFFAIVISGVVIYVNNTRVKRQLTKLYNDLGLENLNKNQSLKKTLNSLENDVKVLIDDSEQLKEYADDLEEKASNRSHEIDRKNADLENINNQLQIQTQELERLHQVKANLFGNISHEFRTPLTLIMGPVAQMMKHADLNTEDRTQLVRIYRNVLRLRQLIEQIVDLNRLDANTLELRLRKVNVNKFLRLICHSYTSLIESKNLSYDIQIPEKSIYLLFDPDKIEKVIYNLLNNAVKFTDPGGKITVEMKDFEDHISISVADTGIGMDEKQQQLIFERYQSIGKENIKYKDGLGIGLSLTQEYLRLHQAKIEVDSKPDIGTRFTLHFKKGEEYFADKDIYDEPYHIEDVFLPEPKFSNAPDTATNRGEKKVLVVEDNTELGIYISSTLSSKEFNVTLAENGVEALKQIHKNPPDIIVSDVMMPKMDGFEMLKKLREREETRTIPVIFLTALTDIQDKIRSLQIGVNDYIVKPFDTDELVVRIRNLISFSEMRMEMKKVTELESPANDLEYSDDEFVHKITEWVNDNMVNEKLTTDSLAFAMNMSRSTLYREIKRTTGLSAAAFIKEVRLQFAHNLLETGRIKSLSALSNMVGFSNITYFRDLYIYRFGKEPFE